MSDSAQPNPRTAEIIATALLHHREGRWREAERLYREILRGEPDNIDALHYLGVIAHQAGRHDAAIALIEKAAALRPVAPDIQNNLGEVYRTADRTADAERCFRRALGLRPEYADAMNNLGNVLGRTGREAQAEQTYRHAISINPDFAEAWNNLGSVLRVLRRDTEAEGPYRRAIALRPAYPEARQNLVLLLRDAGRSEEAARLVRHASALGARGRARLDERDSRAGELKSMEAAYRERLAGQETAVARYQLAGVLSESGRDGEAELEYRRALALDPEMAQAHNDLGNCLRRQGKAEAEPHYRRAIALHPELAEAHNNLGNLLLDAGNVAEAERAYATALALKPGLILALNNLGSLLAQTGRMEEADASYRRALELRPGDSLLSWNYSLFRLQLGDFAQGFRLYESRFDAGDEKAFGAARRVLRQLHGIPRWTGEPLAGQTLLVWTEQGLGDSVMFMRFLVELKERGLERLLVYCEPTLVRLMQSLSAVDEVISRQGPAPIDRFDFHCPIMSLPMLLGTRLETLRAEAPYARVPEELSAKWRARSAGVPGPRIGIAWRSGSLSTVGALRDIALERFAPLLEIPAVSFVSLQKGEGAGDAKRLGLPVASWIDDGRDLLDTAALMAQLDLIVSIDTVIPHLAGALGKPVWLLNRYESDWRWLLGRTDSPWYPSMKIFTQPAKGDWDGALAQVASEARHWLGERSGAEGIER